MRELFYASFSFILPRRRSNSKEKTGSLTREVRMQLFLECGLAIVAFLVVSSVVRPLAARIRFARLKNKMLHLDLVEVWQTQTSQEYRALLLRRWEEQDHLLRWRIVRACDALTTITELERGILTERGRRIIHDPRTALRGAKWKRRKFTAQFPFLRVESVKTTVSVIAPFDGIFFIHDLPVELVDDIVRMEQLRMGIGY
jgi:hypothetical protein